MAVALALFQNCCVLLLCMLSKNHINYNANHINTKAGIPNLNNQFFLRYLEQRA